MRTAEGLISRGRRLVNPLRLTLFIGVSVLLFSPEKLQAARVGMVASDQADVLEAPSATASTVEHLAKGTPIGASNQAVNGFYRVRTLTGQIGYVHGSKLSLQDPPSAQDIERDFAKLNLKLQDPVQDTSSSPQPSQAAAPSERTSDSSDFRRYGKKNESPSDWPWSVGIRATGNLNMYSLSGVIVNQTLSSGIGLGGSFLLHLGSSVSVVGRVESVSKGYTLADSKNTQYLVLASSIPVMGGLEFSLWRTSAIEIDLALLGGMGMNTSLGIDTGSGTSEVNSTVTTSALAGLISLGVQLRVSDAISLFAEAGYRYLKSASVQGDSSDFPGFVNSAFEINMSGPFGGAGIGLYF